MKNAEYIHPNMISEFAYTEEFALKVKALQYLDCRHLGMSAAESESMYNITEEIASRYEGEWAHLRGLIFA